MKAKHPYKSRKLHMAYVVMNILCAAFLATGRWPELHVAFPEFCFALLAAASIYTGSNIGEAFIARKSEPKAAEESEQV